MYSLHQFLCERDEITLEYLMQDMTDAQRVIVEQDWLFAGRASQIPPETKLRGDAWRVWLILAGRGFGKTRSGAQWVIRCAADDPAARIALVAASLHEGRAVMIEGESGILNACPPEWRPNWEASRRRIEFPNGAQAFLYSAEDPDSLRGPQHDAAWCDELAKWPNAEDNWMNLRMGLRLGNKPQTMVTTTPRAIKLLKDIIADKYTAITRGSTHENSAHLPTGFIEALADTWGGTRLGRQELDGELIEDIPGALWTRDALEKCRVRTAPDFIRVIVGVDPAVSAGANADACGISVVGMDREGYFYVVADLTVQGASPLAWAQAVISAYDKYGADRIVAEANNGGALVSSVLHQVDKSAPVQLVHATRGKIARAEPIALLYEQGRVRHVGAFADLEDQLCGFSVGGEYQGPGKSPDRADALIWALAALAKPAAEPKMRMI